MRFDDAFALGEDALLGLLVGIQDGLRQFLADLEAETPDQFAGILVLLVDGQAQAQAEFGVVFEQRVGPRRSAALVVGAVGRGGQVAAVDGGAAGGVADHHAVAEELRDQLEVGVSPQPEQAPENSNSGWSNWMSFTWVGREQLAVGFGKAQEEIPVGGFGFRAAAAGAPC